MARKYTKGSRTREKLRQGMIKLKKGKRYKLNRNSRWQREGAKAHYYKDDADIIRARKNQNLMTTRDNPELNTNLKRISGVKTYHVKTKSELRDRYMEQRSGFTRAQRTLAAGSAVYVAIEKGRSVKHLHPFLGILDEPKIKKLAFWKRGHGHIGTFFKRGAIRSGFKAEHILKGKKLSEKKYRKILKKYPKTKDIYRAAYSLPGSEKGRMKAKTMINFFKKLKKSPSVFRRGLGTFGRGKAKVLHTFGAKPSYGVIAGALTVLGTVSAVKWLHKRRYYHAVETRAYEYKKRERSRRTREKFIRGELPRG